MNKELSALEYGANLLARYSKTEQGFRLKMKTKNFTEVEIDQVVLELNKLGYLSDSRYAHNYAKRFEHKGNHLIKVELTQKGISLDYIERALCQLDKETERARKVSLYKWPTIRASDVKKKQEKLLFFLSSRGFSYSVCRKISEEIAVSAE